MNTTPRYTREELMAGIEVLRVIADTIREAGRIPSGTLYAALMAQDCSLSSYQRIIDTLKNAGLITEQAHELVWNVEVSR